MIIIINNIRNQGEHQLTVLDPDEKKCCIQVEEARNIGKWWLI